VAVIHSRYPEAGVVTIDRTTCTDCGCCAQICPTDVLRLDADHVTIHADSPLGCIACGHCMMACPEQSVNVMGRGLSPADLMPLPPPNERATAEAFAALLQARRSVRRFTDQDVDSALLERIVALAASGPMGVPPWDMGCVVVRGRAEVRQLAAGIIQGYAGFLKVVRPWLLTALRPFVRTTTYERFRSFIRPLAEMYVEGHRQGRDLLFYDAPAVLVFHHSPYADLADATIACAYAMLAAEALGLGTTMIGGAAPMLQRNPALCRRLGIPPNHTPAIADPGPSGDALPASGAPPFCRRPDDSCRRRVGAPLTRPDGRLRGAPIPPTTAGGHRLARVAGRCAVTLQSSVQQHPRDPATPLCAGGLCLLRRGGRFEGGRVCLRRKGHRGHGHQWPSCQTLTASTGYSSIRTFSRRLSLIQTRSTTSVTRNSPSERQNPR